MEHGEFTCSSAVVPFAVAAVILQAGAVTPLPIAADILETALGTPEPPPEYERQ